MWLRRDLASAGMEQSKAEEPQSQNVRAVLFPPARAAQIPTDQCNLLGLLTFWWRFQGIGCLTVPETLLCCCAAPGCVPAFATDGSSSSSARRQLRLLDSFSLHEPGRAHLLLPVEALRDRQHGAIVASGTVVQAAPTGPFLPSAEAGGLWHWGACPVCSLGCLGHTGSDLAVPPCPFMGEGAACPGMLCSRWWWCVALHAQQPRCSSVSGCCRRAPAGAGSVAVTTGPVLDWCLEYGDHPAVWIITAAAW